MENKYTIGYSDLTERVFLGRLNKDKTMWLDGKKDITSEFLGVLSQYFPEGTMREVIGNKGSNNLVINIKNDKEAVEKLIKTLTKELEKF